MQQGRDSAKKPKIYNESIIKTPQKQQIRFVKASISSESQDNKNKPELCTDPKIKDFSDFKELLKDLRFSLHVSELSVMNDKPDDGAQ